MVILLKEEVKSQVGLVVLTVILVMLLFFLARDLIIKTASEEIITVGPFKEITIKEEVFKNELVEVLFPLESIVPAPEMGRDNPFLHY